MTELSCDYLVVGAGMAGLSVAAILSAHGRVIIVEQEEHPAYHATGRSAAVFAESYGAGAVQRLTKLSRPFFESVDVGSGAPLLHRRGVLHVAFETSKAKRFESAAGLERLSAEQAQALVPILRLAAITDCVLEPDASDIDVHALHSYYVKIAKANGAVLRLASPVVSGARSDGFWNIQAGDATIAARIVVNAAGAWAGPLAELLGAADPGLQPLKRSAAIVDSPDAVNVNSWPMVVDIDETVYFKPEGGKLMVSPADEEPCGPHDAFAEDLTIAEAIDRFQTITTAEVRRVTTPWAGLRTFAPDRMPVIGFDPSVEGLFWLAGQGGYGIQLAPAAAALAASLLIGRPIELAADEVRGLADQVSPSRFRPLESAAPAAGRNADA